MSKFTEEKAEKFMRQAIAHALEFSKDSSTKVAAMIIGRDGHEIRSSGYNGMPRGCHDDKPERQERPEKYFWYEHAERNAIYNAARVGTQLAGSLLLVTIYPCMDCARAIVQSGIEEVVSLAPSPEFAERWNSNMEKSAELFAECGIEVRLLDREKLIEDAHPDARAFYRSFLAGN